MLRQRNRERAPKEFCISLSFSSMALLTSIGSRRNHCKHHSNTALQWESHAGKCVLALIPKPYVCWMLLTVCRICCLQYDVLAFFPGLPWLQFFYCLQYIFCTLQVIKTGSKEGLGTRLVIHVLNYFGYTAWMLCEVRKLGYQCVGHVCVKGIFFLHFLNARPMQVLPRLPSVRVV